MNLSNQIYIFRLKINISGHICSKISIKSIFKEKLIHIKGCIFFKQGARSFKKLQRGNSSVIFTEEVNGLVMVTIFVEFRSEFALINKPKLVNHYYLQTSS